MLRSGFRVWAIWGFIDYRGLSEDLSRQVSHRYTFWGSMSTIQPQAESLQLPYESGRLWDNRLWQRDS